LRTTYATLIDMQGSESVEAYLTKLGLTPEATKTYTELAKLGPSTALQLSKTTGTARTQTYRCLETLQTMGLASAEKLSYGRLYRSLPLENIEALLADRDAQTQALRADLRTMSDVMQQLAGSAGPKATAQHYYGLAGLKQVNWNLTKAEGEYRVFEAAHLSQHLDRAFAKRYRERCIERELTSYDLTNADAVSASELEPFEPSRTFLRHINPEVLTINFEVYIYNDVVTLLDYSAEQQLALEIRHPTLHAMMHQLFDAMWASSKPLTIER